MPVRLSFLPVVGSKGWGDVQRSYFSYPSRPVVYQGGNSGSSLALTPAGPAHLCPSIRVSSSVLPRQEAVLALPCAEADEGQGQFSHSQGSRTSSLTCCGQFIPHQCHHMQVLSTPALVSPGHSSVTVPTASALL